VKGFWNGLNDGIISVRAFMSKTIRDISIPTGANKIWQLAREQDEMTKQRQLKIDYLELQINGATYVASCLNLDPNIKMLYGTCRYFLRHVPAYNSEPTLYMSLVIWMNTEMIYDALTSSCDVDRHHRKYPATAHELEEKNNLIKHKKRFRFRKTTLYEREVTKNQKGFIRWQTFPLPYNRWLGNHSFKAAI
jgi:hypothetical protein